METPNLPAIRPFRPAGNTGRIVRRGVHRDQKHVRAIGSLLELAKSHRNRALFNKAICPIPWSGACSRVGLCGSPLRLVGRFFRGPSATEQASGTLNA